MRDTTVIAASSSIRLFLSSPVKFSATPQAPKPLSGIFVVHAKTWTGTPYSFSKFFFINSKYYQQVRKDEQS